MTQTAEKNGRTSAPGPGSQQALRERNITRLLSCLKTQGPATQRELSTRTGLSPASVSNLVKLMQASGQVQVTATISSGRRANRVQVTPG